MWWTEHWGELALIGAMAVGWGRLSQQLSQNTRALEALTDKVGQQNGRVGKTEQAIAHIQGEIMGYRDRT